jgi:hypothetical protein
LPKSLALLGRGFFLAFFCYSKNVIDANFLFFLVFVSAHYSASIRHSQAQQTPASDSSNDPISFARQRGLLADTSYPGPVEDCEAIFLNGMKKNEINYFGFIMPAANRGR